VEDSPTNECNDLPTFFARHLLRSYQPLLRDH